MTSTKSLSACFCLCVCSIASFLARSVVSAISRGQCELQHCLFKLTSNGLVSLLDCCGSSRQTPRFHYLIASRGGVAGAGGMYGKPVQKGVSSTWGCCVMGKRSLCSREHSGAWLGNLTWWCRSWACGFGFGSGVAKKAAEKKTFRFFPENLCLYLFRDNTACFLFIGSCLLNYSLGFLKAGKEHRASNWTSLIEQEQMDKLPRLGSLQ